MQKRKKYGIRVKSLKKMVQRIKIKLKLLQRIKERRNLTRKRYNALIVKNIVETFYVSLIWSEENVHP
jgi:hypothetical protein